MKFVYLQDTHIKGKNPENRIGDYYSDVMVKIKETIAIAKEKGAECIIHGGDLYDTANVSNIMVDELIDIIEQSGIEWLIVPGNHDEIGHSWELSKGSSLAHIIRRSNKITELTDCIINASKEQEVTSCIQGFRYYHNIENNIKEKGLYSIHPKAKYKIAITHAMITINPFFENAMYIQAKDIKTDFDIVLCAHYHIGWLIKEFNGTKFVNIGALGRIGIDEVKSSPQIAYIDTNTKEIEIILLKTAKPGKEVFDIVKVTKKKEFDGEIDNFIKSLSNVKIQGLDLRGIIENISKETKADREVVDELIKRIGEFE